MGFASRLLFSRPRQERSHSFDLTEHVSEAKATITSSPSVPRLAASFVDNEILLKPALAGLLSRSYFNPASRGPPHNESVLSKTSRLECVVSGQFDSRMVVEIDDRLCLRCLLCGRAIWAIIAVRLSLRMTAPGPRQRLILQVQTIYSDNLLSVMNSV